MKLEEGYKKLKKMEKKSFKSLNLESGLNKKGGIGQSLEGKIGLKSGSHHLDFEDGELKSHKCGLKDGKILPKETVALTKISSNNIDDYLESSFSESLVGSKISNLLFAPVIKEKEKEKLNPSEWFITNITLFQSKKFEEKLEEDFNFIISEIINNKRIKTINGPNDYLQIRSKDSKPYKPIISKKLDKKLSDKEYAFYFKKAFIKSLVNKEL